MQDGPSHDRQGDEVEVEPFLRSADSLKPTLSATWALACGCVTTCLFRWDALTTLRAVGIWLIADAALGFVFRQLVALKSPSPFELGPLPANAPRLGFVVPYAVPGSSGFRLAQAISELVARWPSQIWPHAGRRGVAALVVTGLVLVTATLLGRAVLAAVSCGLLLAVLLAIGAGRNGVLLSRWMPGLHLALALVLGRLAAAPWSWPALGLALCVGLRAYCDARAEGPGARLARTISEMLWCLLVVALLTARQPILAGALAVAALLEWALLRPRPARAGGLALPASQVRYVLGGRSPGWPLAAVLAALGVAYWG